MARLIKGNSHLDIYYYEISDNGLLVDGDVALEYSGTFGTLHEYSDVFPLKRCMYGGVEMKCPRYPKKFLEIVYGANVMKPNSKCVNLQWIDV